jgi:hypothetical protein
MNSELLIYFIHKSTIKITVETSRKTTLKRK